MDRFDICEAHAVLEWDYNVGGWLQERPSNQRRFAATSVQLSRLHFKARPDLSFDTLTDDGKYIYLKNVLDWRLPRDVQLNAEIRATFSEAWLQEVHPLVHEELYAAAVA